MQASVRVSGISWPRAPIKSSWSSQERVCLESTKKGLRESCDTFFCFLEDPSYSSLEDFRTPIRGTCFFSNNIKSVLQEVKQICLLWLVGAEFKLLQDSDQKVKQ